MRYRQDMYMHTDTNPACKEYVGNVTALVQAETRPTKNSGMHESNNIFKTRGY